MAADERWYFTREELNNSPSRRCGIDAEKELSYRQQAAHYIQDMGQRLQVNQLAINTAIVYMHRFYMYHSFTRFHRNAIAPAVLFLAAKVEEQPRKLEHVIKVAYHCLNRDQPALDTQSEIYLEKAQELVVNENILLQTLGFDVAIDHPHSHVVRCCQLVRATKDLAQTSYFMATSSLHMTTMCLQYKPTVVACVCIYIVCTWSHYEIQSVSEGKDWFWYVDKTVTHELLETLTAEFLAILDKFPSRLKKVMNATQHSEDRAKSSQAVSSSTGSSRSSLAVGTSSSISSRSHDHNSHAKPGVKGQPPQPHQHQQPQKYNLKEYNEKREKERREREKMRDRDLVDPRDSKQFTLVATSHSSHSAPPSTVQTIASSHANLHPSIPMRSKSGKSSMGRSSHPEPVKSTGSNHKAHSHGVSLSSRDSQQPIDPLRIPSEASRSDQRRDVMRSDSERYDKSSRTSSSNSNSVVDNRVAGHDVKPSVSDLRQQHMLDIKPSRQSLDSAVDRKSCVKIEAKVTERKPPEIKQEQVKVKNEMKSEVKAEPKEDVKPQYNTIFNNSDMPEFTLNDFLNDSSFLNLSDGPPEDLFDNSDSESKTDIPGLIDKNLVPQTSHPKLNKSPHLRTRSPHSCHQQQSSNHGQLPTSHGAVTSNAEQRVSESSGVSTSNYHNSRHHHSATNGSVPAFQPQVTSQQQSKSSSSSSNSSRRSRDSERKNSERTEAELVPMVTKLEDTKYRTALNDPATPVKVWGEQAALAAQASAAAAPTAAAATTTATTTTVGPSVATSVAPSSTGASTAPVAAAAAVAAANPAPPAPSSTANTTSKAPPVPHSVPAVASSDQTQWKNSQPPTVLNLKRPRAEVVKEPEADQSGKKVKYEHGHHKHKEKKKHKHKEKDKNKDREHKEHKEHKKDKKHKKRKDKDKDRDKERSRPNEEVGGSAPIRITIAKDKVLYTPEPAAPLRVNASAAPAAATALPGSTPGIPKFKIQKNRIKPDLFGSTSTSPESSPAGDLKDTPTAPLKIRISRDRICSDKESKKRRRDHSPGGDLHMSKMSRNGSDALSSHNSPQVPIKDLDPSRWSSQRQ
ncbi:cyclin-T2-like isoform X1 [Macrobrachium nipponense]|uniref:cyclin-T2-like isoform X1 n=1 Tax=Macrobrachium nipponense TaxID=159736 RepID=UPI0030C8CDAC